MCTGCNLLICDGCPEADMPASVYECHCCDTYIRAGEDYYCLKDIGYVHKDCIDRVEADEWLKITGTV